MADSLEERLAKHARSFEGLMSLIPAKEYYGEDNSDQWRRKKQTKEQKRAAKMAKYDPTTQKSAKDVLDENERKRKRDMGIDDDNDDYLDASGKEKPLEGLKMKANKRQKKDSSSKEAGGAGDDEEAVAERKKRQAEKRKEKTLRKRERDTKRKEKAARKKTQKHATKADATTGTEAVDANGDAPSPHEDIQDIEMIDRVDISGMVDDDGDHSQPSTSPSPEPESRLSPESATAGASSTSSIVPSTAPDEKPIAKSNGIEANIPDHEELQARLHARIEALRAVRKADGPDGRPARNRAELLEERRRKADAKKARAKEQRKLARDDDARQKVEAELALLRGSGSPLSTPGILTPRSPPENNFSFGRIAFADGVQMDSKLGGLVDRKKKKGPQDARGALQAAKNKHARISGYDEDKKADIATKDLWLNAKKKAHGERVRDDMSLLKSTLKKKQNAKAKSEAEWNNRAEGVKKGKEMRQKKREENLRKRRDEKGGKGKKKGVVKVKSRPGFEGSFSRKKLGGKGKK